MPIAYIGITCAVLVAFFSMLYPNKGSNATASFIASVSLLPLVVINDRVTISLILLASIALLLVFQYSREAVLLACVCLPSTAMAFTGFIVFQVIALICGTGMIVAQLQSLPIIRLKDVACGSVMLLGMFVLTNGPPLLLSAVAGFIALFCFKYSNWRVSILTLYLAIILFVGG